MSIPIVKFGNNDDAAHAVFNYLNKSDPLLNKFTLRPFNRFIPEFSPWWFFPKSEGWPVYHCSKLFVHSFYPQSDEDNLLYVGYYVEKGLGKELSGMSGVKNSNIMESNWYWHEFINNAKNNIYDEPVKEVIGLSGCQIWVTITANEFNEVPEPDTEIKSPHDYVQFSIHSQDPKLKLEQQGQKLLSEFNECKGINEIVQISEAMEGLSFFWINLYIGIQLKYGTDKEGTWSAADIWHNALEPWEPWTK
jgi:hypothetical protein